MCKIVSYVKKIIINHLQIFIFKNFQAQSRLLVGKGITLKSDFQMLLITGAGDDFSGGFLFSPEVSVGLVLIVSLCCIFCICK